VTIAAIVASVTSPSGLPQGHPPKVLQGGISVRPELAERECRRMPVLSPDLERGIRPSGIDREGLADYHGEGKLSAEARSGWNAIGREA
jgi:hypothetical protein